MVVNLVANAIKFTEQGEIGVVAQVDALTGDDLAVRFTVSDTGIGIPRQKHDAIFAAFAQADASTTRKYGGTGLGLTISARLVSMMGGRIWLESEMRKRQPLPFHRQVPKAATGQDTRASKPLTGHTVLILEGHPGTRQSLAEMAARLGLSASVATNETDVRDALLRATKGAEAFDFLWCDTRFNGLESFLRDPRLCNSHAILLGAGGQAGEAQRWRRLGVAGPLKIPVREPEMRAAAVAALAAPAGQPRFADSSPEPAFRHASLRVLLAEDNTVNQRVGQRLLEKLGHSVVVVENGRQALRAVEEQNFDVVFMDVQMPELDGLEAAAAIRKTERSSGKHLPIVAMTAHAMKGDRERCLAAGMDGYLSKPIRTEELAAALAEVHSPVGKM
ncbi:MAG: response regulator [Ignavibacteriota bacterium]